MVLRKLAATYLSQLQRTELGNAYVSLAPRPIQRASESIFDFPISRTIRSRPLLLIRVPRAGSVSAAFHVYGQVDGIPHRTAEFYYNSDPYFFARCLSFAIVRNPWERLVSAYKFLKEGGASLAKPNAQTRLQMRHLKSIENLVSDYLEPNVDRLHRLDPTLHHQHSYVCGQDGKIIVNRVFRMEQAAEIGQFMASAGLDPLIPHLNASKVHGRAMAMLSPGLEQRIAAIYAEDIKMFGYNQG